MIALTFLFYWVPVVLWAGLIFYLSSIPSLNSGLGVWDFVLRKCAHVFEYAVLSFLLARALGRSFGITRKVLAWTAMLALLYAASDEYHQTFVPGRGPSVHDVVIDSIGIALAVWIKSRA